MLTLKQKRPLRGDWTIAQEEDAEEVAAPTSLLEEILNAAQPLSQTEAGWLQDGVAHFLRLALLPDNRVSPSVQTNLKVWISTLDQLLSAQLNAVLHHPAFQKLESTWRGLHYLVHQGEDEARAEAAVTIRVLNVTRQELFKDMERAAEFDQSALFKKIYEEEYGMLGGQPYGLLVSDFEFGRQNEDISLLRMLSGVAASAHAPLVAGASPKMFGQQRFTELACPSDLTRIFEGVEYIPWKSFRQSEDSRYVALTLPRVLARLPYGANSGTPVRDFDFEEDVDGQDQDKYLWMSAAWAHAARIVAAFVQHGWMARIRGLTGGGRVADLPVHSFPTDPGATAYKFPLEVALSDRREVELTLLGFLPLLETRGSPTAFFPAARSCQQPRTYHDPVASANAQLSALFNLLLCTSRFAHYLKVMARDKLGSFLSADECSSWLNRWLNEYCVQAAGASEEARARRPLSEAKVTVREVKGKPGWYETIAYLRPHYQLEMVTASMRLIAEVPQKK
jgi:type VI secretion system protein ImpC